MRPEFEPDFRDATSVQADQPDTSVKNVRNSRWAHHGNYRRSRGTTTSDCEENLAFERKHMSSLQDYRALDTRYPRLKGLSLYWDD